MAIDKKFIDQFIQVTSKAAIASSYFVGKKDKIAADKAAVDSMRSELNNMDIKGQIVIGEGELDEAPMLYIGEKLGTNNGPELDIAVDPLEGTNFAANNIPGALSVIAMLILAFIFVIILQNLSELTAVTLFISFAPGGVTEMSLIALSVASSPALVSAHHIFRIITTVSLLGIIYNRWINKLI